MTAQPSAVDGEHWHLEQPCPRCGGGHTSQTAWRLHRPAWVGPLKVIAVSRCPLHPLPILIYDAKGFDV